jgi:hypothetical protein
LNRYIAPIFICLVAFAYSLPAFSQAGKLPQPPPLEQEETSKLIKKLFKSEYSKRGIAARRDLAKVLFAKAKREKADMVARFVLLKEAMDLSTRSADLETALDAYTLMDEGYLINPVQVKESLLSAFPRTKSLITEETVFDEWMNLVDLAIHTDDYPAAERFAGLARKRAARDKLLLGIAKDKGKYIKVLEKRFEEVKPVIEKLAGNPENVEANGVIGEFIALYKRDWKSGMPLLGKGPEGEFKKLAAAEFSASAVPLELQGVADGWWEQAQANKDLVRISCLMRAAYWYGKLLAGLEGLSQVRIQKRLAEIEKEIGAFRGVKLSELQVLCYQDRRWKRHSLEKMTLARRGEALAAKNTTGIWRYAMLSSKRLLRGDFSATVNVSGGRCVGITSDDLRSKRLEIELKAGWNRVRIVRVGKSVNFSVNGKPVKWKAGEYQSYYGEINPEQTSYLFISINSGQQCSVQTIEIDASSEEFGSSASDAGDTGDTGDDDRREGEDEDRARFDGRGRSSGRGRSGGRGRG